jgi:hypothetical protein
MDKYFMTMERKKPISLYDCDQIETAVLGGTIYLIGPTEKNVVPKEAVQTELSDQSYDQNNEGGDNHVHQS